MTPPRVDTDVRRPPTDARLVRVGDDIVVERLRSGSAGEALWVLPGAGGELAELQPLVSGFVGSQEVYGVMPSRKVGDREPHPTIEGMAESVLTAIRAVQPSGPYRLAGYSFGGLMALELAQQLTSAGQTVEALFLIDTVYDERYWARRLWVHAMARRTRWQLQRIAHLGPRDGFRELRFRSARLVRRVMRRNADAPDLLLTGLSDGEAFGGVAAAAMSAYQPRYYPGTVTLIASSNDRHFGSDTPLLWEGHAARLLVQRVEGDHLTVMHDPATAAQVARVIDHRLARGRASWTGLKPMPGFQRPLILTTMRWFSAARLAHALTEAGFAVSACRPRGHPLAAVDGLVADCRLNRMWRKRSLLAAIRTARPDIVIADDERALALLRRLHDLERDEDPAIAALIAHSLGPSDEWPSITSRAAFATDARAMDLAAPATAVVSDRGDLAEWIDRHGFPTVLKTDGSWGGRGTMIVRDPASMSKAWRRISRPPSVPRALKRTLFNLEIGPLSGCLRRARPIVNAQQFTEGRDAIVTVACLDGKVHALACFEVLQASEPRGPAAVVRVIHHADMANAARRLVARYRLSGFCGFDFVLPESGKAWLLEVNPRITPTCHFLVEGEDEPARTVTLFPARPEYCDASGAALVGVLDRPQRAPALVRRGETTAARESGYRARTTRWLKQTLNVGALLITGGA
jgi:thioesterase domain-containing protein